MKDLIIQAIDIDKFITFQNGDLITSFANPTLDTEKQVNVNNIRRPSSSAKISNTNIKYKIGDKIECNYHGLKKWYLGTIIHINRNGTYDVAYDKIKVNIEDYSGSKIYQKIKEIKRSEIASVLEAEHLEEDEVKEDVEEKDVEKKDVEENWEFLQRVAESFENFKLFLSDPAIMIDYTYLWDIVCTKNPLLFPNGINLIILEMPEDDGSNNIDLVCPTNHYSSHAYDSRKNSLFLIKRENWFEPIFSFRNNNGTQIISPTFDETNSNLRDVFEKVIKPTLGEKCRALLSRPNEYRFKQ